MNVVLQNVSSFGVFLNVLAKIIHVHLVLLVHTLYHLWFLRFYCGRGL